MVTCYFQGQYNLSPGQMGPMPPQITMVTCYHHGYILFSGSVQPEPSSDGPHATADQPGTGPVRRAGGTVWSFTTAWLSDDAVSTATAGHTRELT